MKSKVNEHEAELEYYQNPKPREKHEDLCRLQGSPQNF